MAAKQWTQKADGPASTLGTAAMVSNSQSSVSEAQQSDSIGAAYTVLIFGGFRNGQAINEVWKYTSQALTGITTIGIIEGYKLEQNYPNPFNPSTTISYQLSAVSFVTLKVFDVLGRDVATLVNNEKRAGNYKVMFDANSLASGIYYYTLRAGSFIESKKMILLK